MKSDFFGGKYARFKRFSADAIGKPVSSRNSSTFPRTVLKMFENDKNPRLNQQGRYKHAGTDSTKINRPGHNIRIY